MCVLNKNCTYISLTVLVFVWYSIFERCDVVFAELL